MLEVTWNTATCPPTFANVTQSRPCESSSQAISTMENEELIQLRASARAIVTPMAH